MQAYLEPNIQPMQKTYRGVLSTIAIDNSNEGRVEINGGYFLLVRYSCIALAARLPAPMALITVAAPVATSPPAYTPSRLVLPTSLTQIVPCLGSLCRPSVVR